MAYKITSSRGRLVVCVDGEDLSIDKGATGYAVGQYVTGTVKTIAPQGKTSFRVFMPKGVVAVVLDVKDACLYTSMPMTHASLSALPKAIVFSSSKGAVVKLTPETLAWAQREIHMTKSDFDDCSRQMAYQQTLLAQLITADEAEDEVGAIHLALRRHERYVNNFIEQSTPQERLDMLVKLSKSYSVQSLGQYGLTYGRVFDVNTATDVHAWALETCDPFMFFRLVTKLNRDNHDTGRIQQQCTLHSVSYDLAAFALGLDVTYTEDVSLKLSLKARNITRSVGYDNYQARVCNSVHGEEVLKQVAMAIQPDWKSQAAFNKELYVVDGTKYRVHVDARYKFNREILFPCVKGLTVTFGFTGEPCMDSLTPYFVRRVGELSTFVHATLRPEDFALLGVNSLDEAVAKARNYYTVLNATILRGYGVSIIDWVKQGNAVGDGLQEMELTEDEYAVLTQLFV